MPKPKRIPYDLTGAPLLRSVVGSRLHGFAHTGSDHDAWHVVPEPEDHSPTLAAKRIFQVIEASLVEDADGGRYEVTTDVTYVGIDTFLRYCANGVPQALETLYSPEPEVDLLGSAFRFSYRVDPHTMRASYRRQVKSNILPRADEPKQRRHGFRLALNLDTALTHGWFNPRLTDAERAHVLSQAEARDGFEQRLEDALGMSLTDPETGAA